MYIKHRIIAVLAVICLTAAAVMGSRFEMNSADDEMTGLSLFERKETIHFWYPEEELSDFIYGAAVEFGERRGVRVIPRLVEESEYIEAINEATLHEDQFPDAYLIGNESLEKAYLAGLACKIADRGALCTESNFPKAALSAVTYQDKLTAYPFYFDTTVLVYNRNYLDAWIEQRAQAALAGEDMGSGDEEGEELTEEALAAAQERIAQLLTSGIPRTVDDIRYFGDTFDTPEGVDGIMKWDTSDIFYNYWFVGNYMNVGGEAGDDSTRISINNAETLQCLEVYKALNQFLSIESDTVTYDSVIQDFIDGKLVFTIGATDVVQKLKEAVEKGELDFEYGFAEMPQVSDTLNSRSLSVTTAVAINGYSEHKELAEEFAAYLTGEYSRSLYERTGKVPSSLSANRGKPQLEIFLNEYASSISMPKMMATSNLWLRLEVLFSRIWNGGDSAALLKELSDQVQLQLDGEVG